jgi:hypothetical protein
MSEPLWQVRIGTWTVHTTLGYRPCQLACRVFLFTGEALGGLLIRLAEAGAGLNGVVFRRSNQGALRQNCRECAESEQALTRLVRTSRSASQHAHAPLNLSPTLAVLLLLYRLS